MGEYMDFKGLNHLKDFPRSKKSRASGRWAIRSSDQGHAFCDRKLWFCSEELKVSEIRRATGIQLITHSHDKVSHTIPSSNTPSGDEGVSEAEETKTGEFTPKAIDSENQDTAPKAGDNKPEVTTPDPGNGDIKKTTPQNSTWFEIRVCKSKRDALAGDSKTDDKGQLLEWLSHRHRVQSEEEEWCLGRLFNQDDNIVKFVEDGDILAVYICASGNRSNHAKEGHLCFEYGGYKGCDVALELPPPSSAPKILVYGEKRPECLMTPIAGSSAKRAVKVAGGVDLMERLLENEGGNWTVEKHYLNSKHAAPDPHTIFELEDAKKKDKGLPDTQGQYETVKQYTLHNHDKLQQYKTNDTTPWDPQKEPPTITKANNADPKIIIWNDFGVRRREAVSAQSDARLLIYQMRSPVFQNELWSKAIKATRHQVNLTQDDTDSKGFQRVLIVVDAEDLRAHGFNISRRVSWEKTMEDFQAHFKEFNGDIWQDMHVIVRLGYEGAIYVPPTPKEFTGEPQFHCYLVPDKAEGDLLRSHKGNIPGIDMVFVAGLAASLVRESNNSLAGLGKAQVESAVDLALTWCHRYAGVRFCTDSGSLNYPCSKDFDMEGYSKPKLMTVDAQGVVKATGNWSLFTLMSSVKGDVSSDIVIKGSTEWLESSVPTARFGNLLTADRKEIECFRSTAAVIDEYLALSPDKPLSIAVFGSPGAGKSFGVKQVIQTMLPDVKEPIEVNLSQFMSHSELLATFHNIRDMALAGKMPVVMFDEFDSVFEQQDLGWLKYFSAPMQDGYFLENGQKRSLEKAIFIFIGGTSATWAEFTEGMDKGRNQKVRPGVDLAAEKKKEKEEKDKKAKKPDFVSRLSAYIDIRGLNKMSKGNEDEMYTIRRAMILRSVLQRRLNVFGDKDIPVDSRVLNALLKQNEFHHGARSIALILQMCALSGRDRFEASALPSEDQLSMHMEVAQFRENIRKDIHNEETHKKKKGKSFRQIDIELRRTLMNRPW